MKTATGPSLGRPMRRNLRAFIVAAQVSASSYTTTRSPMTARGSAFPSGGQTQRPARNRAGPECKAIALRTASSWRHGSRCDRLARHGPTLRRNDGQAQRSKAVFCAGGVPPIGTSRNFSASETLLAIGAWRTLSKSHQWALRSQGFRLLLGTQTHGAALQNAPMHWVKLPTSQDQARGSATKAVGGLRLAGKR